MGLSLTLRELQSQTGNVVRGHDSNVGVGGHFECGQTAGNDKGADDETGKDCSWLGGTDGELGDGPEEDGTDRVESETRDNSELVSSSSEDFGSDRRVGEVTNTKVGGWKISIGQKPQMLSYSPCRPVDWVRVMFRVFWKCLLRTSVKVSIACGEDQSITHQGDHRRNPTGRRGK